MYEYKKIQMRIHALSSVPMQPRRIGGRVDEGRGRLRRPLPPTQTNRANGNVTLIYSLINTYVVPTLLGMNACGMARAIPCVARQPVQCAGTTTAGLICCRAAMVCGMIGSKAGPVRWKPPMTA